MTVSSPPLVLTTPLTTRERLLAATGYLALAVSVTWPLVTRLSTALPGNPTGDTGVYIWNLWIFRHELLRHAHWPFITAHIFALTNGTDLTVHNYTVFADILAFPLIGQVGLVAAFNLVNILLVVLSGYSAFLLIRRLVTSAAAAWIGGALFLTSPFLIARGTAHYSLVAAAPLPLFLLWTLRALASRRARDAAVAGAVMGWAGYCDVYYTIHCLLIGAFVVACHQWSIQRTAPATDSPSHTTRRVIDGLLTVGAVVVGFRLWHGEFSAAWRGVAISLRTLYTPVLCMGTLGLVRIQHAHRWRLDARATALPWRVMATGAATALAAAALLLSPIVIGLTRRLLDGRMPSPPVNWRSSPPGMDVMDFLIPNPNHPWFGGMGMQWIATRGPLGFPEFVGSVSLVALLVIAWACWRIRGAVPTFWIGLTAVFTLLSLGPFVKIASFNTYIPGPWALLRYVPIIGLARSPTRFAVVTALGVSVMLAFALSAIRQRWPAQWRLIATAVCILLCGELIPAPRPLFDATVPGVYSIIRNSPDESRRLLELPTGVRDGTSSIGDFNASAQYFQTVHRKPLMGGYQSRVSEWRKRAEMQLPVSAALFTLSQRNVLPPDLANRARASGELFIDRACLGWVVIDRQRASAALRTFAIETLDLIKVTEDPSRELFVPAHAPAARPCRPVD